MPMAQGEQYTIVQTNPMLKEYDGKDERVKLVGGNYVKTQTITAPAASEDFQMLVGDGVATATVKLYKGAVAVPAALVKTYTIKSSIAFAPAV